MVLELINDLHLYFFGGMVHVDPVVLHVSGRTTHIVMDSGDGVPIY